MSRPPIVVIADDLSGAAELAGIAFAHGLSAEVQTRFEPGSTAQVIAVDTDSRSLPAAEAAARVQAVAAEILERRPAWIYKKVDSVLRGQTRAEIEAILAANGQQRAVLIPANPSRGRTIVNGRYLIGGVPLDQTPFARDPEHPRQTADVALLLGGPSDCISVPDALTVSDLQARAAALDDETLPAGAADFFAVLLAACGHAAREQQPRVVPLAAPALLVCGSFAAWRERQAECCAANLRVVLPQAWAGGHVAIGNTWTNGGALVLACGDMLNAPAEKMTPVEQLTAAAADVTKTARPTSVLVEGGATAAALARQLDWTRFAVIASSAAGVGVLRPLDGGFAPTIMMKPGSYPWPAPIWRAFCDSRR